jgi:hypothetical protein
LYSSPNTILMIKSQAPGTYGGGGGVEIYRNKYRVLVRKHEQKRPLEDLHTHVRMLKLIFE